MERDIVSSSNINKKKKKKKKKSGGGDGDGGHEAQDTCNSRTFGKKCSHIAKKQRAKFYIVRRCISMLLCWHEKDK
ncbi:hypothetical protein QVD17_23273 [Tagetes erecta]|uniref:Uncharacterized protein n=1 Tax=Tagetes erecta TaxID=13708 RepID=A0AAD8KGX9_TARER|nr:hypothetical protein QVD17_23273 [Tagetes erecta]